MGKKSKPKSPDYMQLAEMTGEQNLKMLEEQTKANRPDQYNPWGSVEWSQDADGNWSQTQKLNDALQGTLDNQQQLGLDTSNLAGDMFGRVQDSYSEGMDWDQFGDPNALRQDAEDAAYERATSRLDPRFAQESESLATNLRNRGLSEGDAAYDAAMNNFNMSKEDAYSNAQNRAVEQGRSESTLAAKLRQQDISNALRQRGQPLSEMQALLGQNVQSQGFQNFQGAQQGQGTDYLKAGNMQGNFDQANYQTGMSGFGSMLGLGGTLGAAAIFCDRRLKKHINRIGEYLGYPLYVFEYVWGELAVGVMSDEVNKEAVIKHPSGFDMVDWNKITPMEG